MSFENKFARFMRNTGPGRFLIPVGIILIIVGILLFAFGGKAKDYVETTGKVINVVENEPIDTESNYTYDVYFKYEVETVEYENYFSNLGTKYNVGDTIKLYYLASDPSKVSNTKGTFLFGLIALGLGVAALVGGIVITILKFKKSKELDNMTLSDELKEKYANRPLSSEEQEYYSLYDKHVLKPGYIVEDKDRNVVYEARNTKNIPALTREFEFVNHYNNTTVKHKVGRPFDQSFNDEAFSMTSSFKFDGVNIWDYIHKQGVRIETDLTSSFPYFKYHILLDGEKIATIQVAGKNVHEEDAEDKKINIPIGQFYYRIWTKELDLDLVFLALFAISEANQSVVE